MKKLALCALCAVMLGCVFLTGCFGGKNSGTVSISNMPYQKEEATRTYTTTEINIDLNTYEVVEVSKNGQLLKVKFDDDGTDKYKLYSTVLNDYLPSTFVANENEDYYLLTSSDFADYFIYQAGGQTWRVCSASGENLYDNFTFDVENISDHMILNSYTIDSNNYEEWYFEYNNTYQTSYRYLVKINNSTRQEIFKLDKNTYFKADDAVAFGALELGKDAENYIITETQNGVGDAIIRFYDANGNLKKSYTIEANNKIAELPLGNKVLLQYQYDVDVISSDYTYFANGIDKYNLKTYLLDLATGNKTELASNYYFGGAAAREMEEGAILTNVQKVENKQLVNTGCVAMDKNGVMTDFDYNYTNVYKLNDSKYLGITSYNEGHILNNKGELVSEFLNVNVHGVTKDAIVLTRDSEYAFLGFDGNYIKDFTPITTEAYVDKTIKNVYVSKDGAVITYGTYGFGYKFSSTGEVKGSLSNEIPLYYYFVKANGLVRHLKRLNNENGDAIYNDDGYPLYVAYYTKYNGEKVTEDIWNVTGNEDAIVGDIETGAVVYKGENDKLYLTK